MGNRLPHFERTCMQCAVNCAKATNSVAGVEDFPEDSLTCDPAGAIFEETLEDLNDMDRELLLFSTGQNLAAIRWLFILGADKDSRDSNGTTALHTACRTGSLPIIRELLHQGIPLNVTDSSGWTALHIAIFMCRRDAVLCLLRAGSSLTALNLKGQTALDLCNDAWTREAIHSFMNHSHSGLQPGESRWRFEREDEAQQDVTNTRKLLYEPFFVPRSPVISDHAHKADFYSLGQQIFNKRPGQGLAFMVASGSTRDYPVDLSFFLRRGKLDLAQIGQFLGESFSLSQTLRLEFINSVTFHGTSIVSALEKAFTLLQIPPDLQKIDRLIHGVARIWWRQHDKMSQEEEEREADGAPPVPKPQQSSGKSPASKHVGTDEVELNGVDLKQYLASPETLYQLMFSVIMLHWNLYAPSVGGDTDDDGRVGMSKWLEINRGLEADGSGVPVHILQRTYHKVSAGFVPQLTIRVASAKSKTNASGKNSRNPPLRGMAKIEGWGWIVDHNFMNLLSNPAGTQSTQVQGIFSESLTSCNRGDVTDSDMYEQRQSSNYLPSGPGRPVLPSSDGTSTSKDRVWLSLCYSLLLFSHSPSPDEAPYAFVHLRNLHVQPSRMSESSLSFLALPDGTALDPSLAGGGGKVLVVFLLPDGRWQEFELPRLDIQLADEHQVEKWIGQLRPACSGGAYAEVSTKAPEKFEINPKAPLIVHIDEL